MITGTGCRNCPSALHRPSPIADALPYAAITSFLVRCIMQDPTIASPTSDIYAVSLRSADLGRSRGSRFCQRTALCMLSEADLRGVVVAATISFLESARCEPKYALSRPP